MLKKSARKRRTMVIIRILNAMETPFKSESQLKMTSWNITKIIIEDVVLVMKRNMGMDN